MTRQYFNLLYVFNLSQHTKHMQATRTTHESAALIDHIISNNAKQVKYADVLPCSNISDHDALYVCVDIRITRFTRRFKYIGDERGYDEETYNFIEDFSSLPLTIIDVVDDPNEK